MDDLVKIEKQLRKNSQNSTEDFLKYVLFEIQSPIEDYFLAIDLLTQHYLKYKDIRTAILGAYLSSTWLSFQINDFITIINGQINKVDDQNKAIIYYLLAYDIYVKSCKQYPKEYSDYLRKSILYSNRFVYNYVRLSEITDSKESYLLLDKAISHIENVWDENQLKDLPNYVFYEYDKFVDEFILGVDISIYEYENLISKKSQYYTDATS